LKDLEMLKLKEDDFNARKEIELKALDMEK